MNRCTIPSGSSTEKWLATVTRSHTTRKKCSPDLQTKWRLSRACQSRGISGNRQQASPIQSHDDSDAPPSEPPADVVTAGRDAAALRDGASRKATSVDLESGPEVNMNSASATEIPVNLQHEGAKPAVKRRPLPISPLMDPSFLAAREKRHIPKDRPSKNSTPFQQQLAKNPFALALATPVRRCAVSGTQLPTFFLQGFRVMSDPRSGALWYVPSNLANKHPPAKEKEVLDEVEESQGLKELENGLKEETAMEVAESAQLKSDLEVEEKPINSKLGYQAYTLNSKFLISGMVDTSSGSRRTQKGRPGQAKFIPGAWRAVKSAMQTYGRAGWRPDMDEFALKLMRRRIAEALVYVLRQKRGYVVGCNDWQDALKKPQVAAFLWTGNEGGAISEGPHEFATLDVGTQEFDDVGPQLGKLRRKVPVYNLLELLGKEKMDELRQSVPKSVFEKDVVALKNKNVTVELQSQLWKIQGYVAEHQQVQATQPERSFRTTQADEVGLTDALEPSHERTN